MQCYSRLLGKQRTMTGGHMKTRMSPKRLGFLIITLLVLLPASQGMASPTPQTSDAKPTPGEGKFAPPGEYGSNTYYSDDQEEAELTTIAEKAKSLKAIGQWREAVDRMVTRLPNASDPPPETEKIGSFTVTYMTSQFTAETLKATEAAIVSAGKEYGDRSTYGFYYDGSTDHVLVKGQHPRFHDGGTQSADWR